MTEKAMQRCLEFDAICESIKKGYKVEAFKRLRKLFNLELRESFEIGNMIANMKK